MALTCISELLPTSGRLLFSVLCPQLAEFLRLEFSAALKDNVSVILHASELDACNLYVPIRRAARRLVISGPKPVLCV